MSDLTADELTVLMIASKGESMMPIGRWEAPVESLVARGYLKRNDKFNNVITDAGLAACEKLEDDGIRDLIDANNRIAHAKTQSRQAAEQIAKALADLATLSEKVTGEDKKTALERWSRLILVRALELIDGRP